MLTEYKGSIFNAEINGDSVSIWKYVPVDGFNEVKTRRGITFYEKIVDKNDVGYFFSVIFNAYNADKKFVVKSVIDGEIEVICDDKEYAESHGFSEIEHGVWCKRNTLDNYNRFQLVKCEENSDDEEYEELDKAGFVNAWRVYVKEVEIRFSAKHLIVEAGDILSSLQHIKRILFVKIYERNTFIKHIEIADILKDSEDNLYLRYFTHICDSGANGRPETVINDNLYKINNVQELDCDEIKHYCFKHRKEAFELYKISNYEVYDVGFRTDLY